MVFDKLDVYSVNPHEVLMTLESANGEPGLLDLGVLYYFKIGVAMSGFYDDRNDRIFEPGGAEQDDRGLGVFARGAFDQFTDTEYQPVTFLKT